MALIAQRSLKQLQDLNKSFWAEVSQNRAVPQSVKSMIHQHLGSMWIPDALAVVISPLSGGVNNPYLKQSAFDLGGIQYYYPSLEFWATHAERSHPPSGEGCDPQEHVRFLTASGGNPEFIYSVVKKDGSLSVQDEKAFVDECAFYLAGIEG